LLINGEQTTVKVKIDPGEPPDYGVKSSRNCRGFQVEILRASGGDICQSARRQTRRRLAVSGRYRRRRAVRANAGRHRRERRGVLDSSGSFRRRCGNHTPLEATKYLCPLRVTAGMLGLLQLGGIGTVPAVLAGLVVIAIVLLVGRLVMKIAWRLVIIGIIVVGTIWLLGLLGFGVL